MHLLSSYRNGALRALPTILPPGLYEAASRRQSTSRAGLPQPTTGGIPPVPGIPKQFSGSGQRTSSPIASRPYGTPPQTAQTTGTDWAVSATDKAQFDSIFASVDKLGRGYITGDEAVRFFGNSRLPEDILAQIWDLADINSEGHLNRDEFAVAMHLIRQQRSQRDERGALPSTLPPNLVPPSMRQQPRPPAQPTAPTFDNAAYATNTTRSASEDLFGLDAYSPPTTTQTSSSTSGFGKGYDSDPFNTNKSGGVPPASKVATSSPTTAFKPFMPSSSFGQNMMSATGTGGSGSSGPSTSRGMTQASSNMEDLLGDNDPEVSQRLTSETTDLANLSNQIGTLNKQMQETRTKRTSTEQDLSHVNSQKREFEVRLSQLRSHYEQEVKDVKALESRLSDSRSETRKLQQDCSVLEANYRELQDQHRQIVGALESDQRENMNLKDRMKSINAEIASMKPQLEKLRSDSRKQKGLVAINKKQVVTTEGERDKIRDEIDDLSRGATENSRDLPMGSQVPSPGSMISPSTSAANQNTNPFFRGQSPSGVAGNTMSPTPFTPGGSSAPGQGPTNFENMFGSYPSAQTTGPPTTSFRSDAQGGSLPGISAPSGPSVRSSDGPDQMTPASSPPSSSYHESPRSAEPPAPPESRQITSSFLPFRSDAQRNDSFSSSVKVAAPASRYGDNKDHGRSDTPTNWASSATETPNHERDIPKGLERSDTNKTELGSGASPFSLENPRETDRSPPANESQRGFGKPLESRDSYQSYGGSSLRQESIPGAFPVEPNSPIQPTPTGESTLSDRSKASSRPSEAFQSSRPDALSSSRPDPFTSGRDQPRGPSASKEDFDAAFAGFGSSKGSLDRGSTGGSSNDGSVTGPQGGSRFHQEFPPIEEFERNDPESDSNSEPGFDDNFTPNSPHQKHGSLGHSHPKSTTDSRPGTGVSKSTSDMFGSRPGMSTMTSSASGQLPTPGAQMSPPSYDQTIGPTGKPGSPRDSNQFPQEFKGLLPSRQDPTATQGSPEKPFNVPLNSGQNLFGGSTSSKAGTSTAPTAFSNSPPMSNTPLSTAPSDAFQSAASHASLGKGSSPSATQGAPGKKAESFDDDFDKEFADMSEAKEADDKGDEDFGISSHHHEGIDEFNPVFDSPMVSKSSTMASQSTSTGGPTHPENSFNDFEHNIGGPTQATSQSKAAAPSSATAGHDWDMIFSGLDTPQGSIPGGVPGGASQPGILEKAGPGVSGPGGIRGADGSSSSTSTAKPQLGRAISTGTEHDDPFLKRLTGMGYPRDEALNALEKYDYNMDKVSRPGW